MYRTIEHEQINTTKMQERGHGTKKCLVGQISKSERASSLSGTGAVQLTTSTLSDNNAICYV